MCARRLLELVAEGNEDGTALLAALCASRQGEITDALVELPAVLVHKINACAERRVEKQLTAELKKVRGKEGILFKLATAAVDKPDEVVRRALLVEHQPVRYFPARHGQAARPRADRRVAPSPYPGAPRPPNPVARPIDCAKSP
ncbi:hypothetical protein ABZ667_32575 [Streptomyces lavendulae]|uniref:hypothetical protein n=1 Tax=Streptomyces lavendulae TaxID=1914 RepID=UPI0033DE782E